MAQDFYSTLGISKNATKSEVKSAYRKLALKWHPDKNKEAGAEQKFKEVTAAYEVLSDDDKRKNYDQMGHDTYTKYGGKAGANGAGGPFGGQSGPFSYSYTSSGGGNPFEGFGGGSDPFDIFESFFGGGFGQQRQRRPRYSITISFDEAVKGVEKEATVEGSKRTLKIPAGVDDGTTIRFQDFDLIVGVQQSKIFKREGQDVYLSVDLPFTQAILGTTLEVPTITDEKVKLKVRAGTEPGSILRLQGKGFPFPRELRRGNQYVVFNIVFPKKLSKKQKQLLEDFEKAS